ncbi:MAG: hypothetical protein K2P23_09300 [Lachnospiraceae bacterium]|nr:hypothetical protein [Lachnospiraceae bacterium]
MNTQRGGERTSDTGWEDNVCGAKSHKVKMRCAKIIEEKEIKSWELRLITHIHLREEI